MRLYIIGPAQTGGAFPSLTLAELDGTLRVAASDAHGLTILPSLVAERGVRWVDQEGATVAGVTLGTLPRDIAQAWLEALAQRIGSLLEMLESASGPVREVRASGGAFNTLPGWARTIADAVGRNVRRSAEPEASSRGDALVAARELGWIDSFEAAPLPGGRVVESDTTRSAVHRTARERQARLAERLHDFDVAPASAVPTRVNPVDSHRG